MNKKDFYKQFIGTDSQVLKFGGKVTPPKRISAKAEIIVSALTGASDGWDYSLTQIQEKVFAARGAKADWSASGVFSQKDLVTVADIKQAMTEVFFNRQKSDLWKGSMLELFAMKNGELVLRRVPFIEGFFEVKEKAVKTDEKKDEETDETAEQSDEKKDETADRLYEGSLLKALVELKEAKGGSLSVRELEILEDAINSASWAYGMVATA